MEDMQEEARISALIDDIYAAALRTDDPSPLLGRLAKFLGFEVVGLVTARSRYTEPTCNAAWGLDLALCQRMEEQFAVSLSVVKLRGAKSRPGNSASATSSSPMPSSAPIRSFTNSCFRTACRTDSRCAWRIRQVKFYKTPDAILQKQLEIFDQVAAKKAAENPMFKEILESQRTFAERAVAWDMDTNVSRRMAYNHYFGKKAAPAKKS